MSHHKHNDQIMEGTLDVSGKDEVDIILVGKPVTILVEFKDAGNIVPCDPHMDTLDWEIDFHKKSFVLKIKWDVSGIRTIAYVIDFKE